jgi:hypothetical protein
MQEVEKAQTAVASKPDASPAFAGVIDRFISETCTCVLKPYSFFVSWQGVLTLAYRCAVPLLLLATKLLAPYIQAATWANTSASIKHPPRAITDTTSALAAAIGARPATADRPVLPAITTMQGLPPSAVQAEAAAIGHLCLPAPREPRLKVAQDVLSSSQGQAEVDARAPPDADRHLQVSPITSLAYTSLHPTLIT